MTSIDDGTRPEGRATESGPGVGEPAEAEAVAGDVGVEHAGRRS